MIISKKKYHEDIRKAMEEAVNRVEREQYIHEKIDRLERKLDGHIEGLMRHIMQLEERLEALDHSKERRSKGWRR